MCNELEQTLLQRPYTALVDVAQLVGMLACKPKFHMFKSQSGYMPGLWASPFWGA